MIDFPANPTVGQTFTAVGVTWTWDGVKWSLTGVGGTAVVAVSATPPANPTQGMLWWDSVGGQLYVYFNDGNSAQWVVAVNTGGLASISVGASPPAGPLTGALWWDAVGGQMYIWFNDGTSSQWVPTTNQSAVFGFLPLAGGEIAGNLTVDGMLTANSGANLIGPLNVSGEAILGGTTTNDNAAAGQIGEVISATVTTAVSLTTNIGANVASIPLTAGDWDVQGEIWFQPSVGALGLFAGVSNTSAALTPAPSISNPRSQIVLTSATTGNAQIMPVRPGRISVSVTTTIYLVAQAVFSSGTTVATGCIWARRAR